MLQHFRRIFGRPPGVAGAVACAWLTLGVAPCLMAAPVESHENHDCPHCETVVVATPTCDMPADATRSSRDRPDNLAPAIPADHPVASLYARPAVDRAPPGLPPPERSRLHRFCRLLE
ncbi:MAG TPA: hypothetical protein VF267_12955 [Gammaproteobacteria bacterium]